jgi:hypothetical protein
MASNKKTTGLAEVPKKAPAFSKPVSEAEVTTPVDTDVEATEDAELEAATPVVEAPKQKLSDKKPIQVVAIDKGYYGQSRREIGDKFIIHGEEAFSELWMQKIGK